MRPALRAAAAAAALALAALPANAGPALPPEGPETECATFACAYVDGSSHITSCWSVWPSGKQCSWHVHYSGGGHPTTAGLLMPGTATVDVPGYDFGKSCAWFLLANTCPVGGQTSEQFTPVIYPGNVWEKWVTVRSGACASDCASEEKTVHVGPVWG